MEQKNKPFALSLVIIFTIIITVPALISIFSTESSVSLTEKRLLAPAPHFDIHHSSSFHYELENYLHDHLGFRDQLIYLNSKIFVNILSVSSNKQVLLGRQGVLYLKNATPNYDYYLTKTPLTEIELLQWKCVLTQRTRYFKDIGIVYVFYVVPDKESVYPEYMPQLLSSQLPYPRLLQLQALFSNNSEVLFLSPLAILQEKKSEYPVYYLSDSHWNSLGAFFSYQYLIKSISPRLPTLTTPQLSDYQFEESNYGGDLNNLLGLQDTFPKDILYTPIPIANKTSLLLYRLHTPLGKMRDPAPYNLLLFYDSFGLYFQPFLSQEFMNITYIVRNRGNYNMSYLEEMPLDNITIFIDETVERNMYDYTPMNPNFISAGYPCSEDENQV